MIDDVARNIKNERRGAIDRNPSIDCPECGESYGYKEYWMPRYVDGVECHPRQLRWICDDCLDEMYEWYEDRVAEREHVTLTEWSE